MAILFDRDTNNMKVYIIDAGFPLSKQFQSIPKTQEFVFNILCLYIFRIRITIHYLLELT